MISLFHQFFLFILEVLGSLLFITGYSKLTKLRSKRDPYFGRRVFQKGTPAWVTKNMIATAWVCVIMTNFFMMIAFAFYDELVGINRGSYADQFNRVGSKLFDYINPFNWAQVLSPFPHTTPINSLAWTMFFTGIFILGLYHLRRQWRNIKNDQQDEFGGAEWTEPYEMRQQYLAVPDRGLEYEGFGSVPVGHQFNLSHEGLRLFLATVKPHLIPKKLLKYTSSAQGESNPAKKNIPGQYFIDPKTTNTLLVADTRAGKGKSIVEPTIDLIARGSGEQSLIIGDLKGELSTMTADLLRRHNYDVKIANFDNLNYSMPINLLTQAIYYAKKGNYPRARLKVSQLANTIFPDEGSDAKSKFFTNGAAATFSGLALATLWLMRRENDWDRVTIANVAEMLQVLGTMEESVSSATGERFLKPVEAITFQDRPKNKNKLDMLVDCFRILQKQDIENHQSDPLLDMAIAAFNQSGMGGSETKGNIYASMFSDIEIFTSDINVRKLTTINDFRYSSIGFPRVMELQLPHYFGNRKVQINFKVGDKEYEDLVIADEMGLVQYAIEPKLDDETTFNVTFTNAENRQDLESLPPNMSLVDKYITVKAYKKYETAGFGSKAKRVKDEYSGLDVIDGYAVRSIDTNIESNPVYGNLEINFDYSEKRTALFVILPPLNQQYNTIAMFFIEQLYQENYDWAQRNKNKVINRMHFLMDEFGNFPKWPRLETKLSSALGYNIEFTLVLQNLEQLTDVYGQQTAATIRANSSNFAYIKTSSQDTADGISKMLGNRTIVYSNQGQNNAEGDNRNRQMKEQPLLNPEQLMKFKPGQMLFFRAAKNEDKKGRLVATNPIYDYGWTAMPASYNLLQGYLNPSPELAKIKVDSPQRYINLDDYRIDYLKLFDELYLETHPAYAEFWEKYQASLIN
ncbi:type IV secretory system conjugative DNA transfer family protein [Fructobacillus cardui]|uniref:type IV secretory system conjugative DNA transfer family protein n=1 Tax=Fructobacillus cardui TaxID=2893170 RepID=UPI00200B3E40|nr:type IV secretory system conjugative DNA transfer family protein [Fructobacillus cardui]MCK8627022.1 type IV secretory system conjugative DNA transfer family protein [Fructobacillus cardui]